MAITTNTDGQGRRWWTSAKRSAVAIVVAVVGVGAAITFQSEGNPYNPIDNSGKTFVWGGLGYNELHGDSQAQLDARPGAASPYGAFHDPGFTRTASSVGAPNTNGPGPAGTGNFRVLCDWSHYGNDDPIIKPNEPGTAHLHMFWGNTATNADFTTAEFGAGGKHDLLNNGGGSCQGNAVNRSAYWVPAVWFGAEGPGRQIVAPKAITLYYKTRFPHLVQLFPQGIQLLVGNVNPGGTVNSSFSPDNFLHWGCYEPGVGQTTGPSLSGTIPTNCNDVGSACPSGACDIQATIEFPQCLTGATTSGDFMSHTFLLPLNTSPCPASHPVRVPQISYLIRFDTRPDAEVAQWRLSSDVDAHLPNPPFPGGSLHGDWFGAWHEQTNQAWLDGCFDPGPNVGVNNFAGPQNCSLGQTGLNGTDLMLNRFTGLLNTTTSGYLPDPCPDCRPIP